MAKLSRSEHIARAMLMGLVYAWRFGYYHTPPPILPRKRYDALSLEPVDGEEAKNRQMHYHAGMGGIPYYSEASDEENP